MKGEWGNLTAGVVLIADLEGSTKTLGPWEGATGLSTLSGRDPVMKMNGGSWEVN